MTDNFADRLISSMIEKKSVVCVGLDPRIENIPAHIKEEAIKAYGNTSETVGAAFLAFNKEIIDAVGDVACVVKPQMAFYEAYGEAGVKAFCETVKMAKAHGLLVIEDAKRNDIGETCEAYSTGHLGRVVLCDGSTIPMFDVDALTVNAYLGSDGVKPFVKACKEFGKGIFVLAKTSNKSSGELQNLKLENGDEVYKAMAKLIDGWGAETVGEKGYKSVGMVVGATYPKEAEAIRAIAPHSIKLVPGYGAQGSTAQDILPNFNDDGLGAVVNNSRGVIFAYTKDPWKSQYAPGQFKDAARGAAIAMRDDINKALREAGKCAW